MLDTYTISIIVFVAILLLFIGIKVYYSYITPSSFVNKEDKELSEKLKKCGWKLISKKGCIFCEKQLEIINYPHLDISDVKSDVITEIKGVPLWVNSVSGTTAIGLQTKHQLMELASKC